MMETVAAVLATVVGVMALVRFYAGRNNIFLFIGTGFLGAAVLDAYPVAVAFALPASHETSDIVVLVTWGWVASRLFLSVMLFLGWLFWDREQRLGEAARIGVTTVYLISGLSAVTVLLFYAVVPLMQAHYRELAFDRPEAFAPALLFLASLIGYLRKGRWQEGVMEHWLVLSLIVALAAEVAVLSYSAGVLSNQFEVGMLFKVLGYVCVFIGLVAATHRTYRRAALSNDELATTNNALRVAVAEGADVRQALYASEQSLRNLAQNVPGIVYQQVLHPDGRISFPFMSAGVRDVCGLEARDIKADPSLFLDQIHPDDRKNFRAAIRQSAEALEPLTLDLRFRHASGDEIWLHGNSRPRPGADGTVIWDAIMIEVTERRQAEHRLVAAQTELQARLLELEQTRSRLEVQGSQLIGSAEALTIARNEAEQANLAKSRFLANVSHELRTPLNAVIGLSAILREDARIGSIGTEETWEYLNNINAAGQQLLVLINDILDLSKAEAGQYQLEVVDFNLLDVMESVPRVVRVRLADKKVDLWSFVLPGSPVHLTGDPTRLRQILLNLVDNAVKFTEQGSVLIEASVKEEDEDGLLYRFEVTDTGIGIARDALPKLFASFSQADASMTRRFGGTGLGLAICKRFADLMGGDIGVESELGKGSTFWFTARFGRSLPETLALPHLTDFKNLDVLVIDPIAANRDLLRKQFGSWGIAVSLAADEAEALAELARRADTGTSFDVVMINYLLAEQDSAGLAVRVRAAPGVGPVKLVLVSTAAEFVTAVGLEDSPFDTILVKPVTQSGLFDCLAELFIEDLAVEDRPHLVATATGGDAVAPPEEGLHILVAEDNSLNAMIVVRILSRAAHQVDVVENGAQAVEAVATGKYDLVLMDIQMPEMDGVEATGRIRGLDGDAAQIPIIALTAHAMDGDREKYLDAGMSDYVSKPIIPDELSAAIRRQTGVHINLEPFMPTQSSESQIPQETLDALDNFMDSLDRKIDPKP